MVYIDAATSGTLSLHVLPVIDLQRMLQHTYQFHQKIPYISTDTYILMS